VRFLPKLVLSFCALGLTAHAAVVEGVILDEESGNPLARTQVSLIPLPGTMADPTPVRTAARGSFVILNVIPGWYVLRATRRGYAPTESGQLHPGRPGRAFEVADDRASAFHEIKMSRLPAVTGTVLDENGIGMPRRIVHIYSSGKPIRHIGQTETDDRGNYRIGELEPGSYLLRTAEGHLENETPVLATYTRSAVELGNAVPVTVHYGETAHDINIRPIKGRLLTLGGLFYPLEPGAATLLMITDTGRREVTSSDKARPFSVTAVQPGSVEFLVKGADGFGSECGSYAIVVADKDMPALTYSCNPLGHTIFSISGAALEAPIQVRRVDLDGAFDPHPLARDETLAPGHWEINIPRGNYYVESVRSSGSPAAHLGSWWAFDTGNNARIAISLNTRTSTISGVVSGNGDPVAGAPVYVTQQDSGEFWNVRSDPQGNYQVPNLAPGTYTVVSGFDIDLITPRPQKRYTVSLPQGSAAVQNLELVLP
jgi:hypothetical protein